MLALTMGLKKMTNVYTVDVLIPQAPMFSGGMFCHFFSQEVRAYNCTLRTVPMTMDGGLGKVSHSNSWSNRGGQGRPKKWPALLLGRRRVQVRFGIFGKGQGFAKTIPINWLRDMKEHGHCIPVRDKSFIRQMLRLGFWGLVVVFSENALKMQTWQRTYNHTIK